MHLAIASRYFSPKNPTNMIPGGSALAIHHCRRALLDDVQKKNMFISSHVHHYAYQVRYCILVCENQNHGDKLHRRKTMWATDEKLIINELGPN